MHEDLASLIQPAPDRPWTYDEGLVQLAGLTTNTDPVLRLRGRDEQYFEQLRAEIPSLGSAIDARRRRVVGAASETLPGSAGDERAVLYADFCRGWKGYVGQGPAPDWRQVMGGMWHSAPWGWRPARLSWVGTPGVPSHVRPFEIGGRSDWQVPWRVQPLYPWLYAWTAEGELVELTTSLGIFATPAQVARVIPGPIDAVSHWHVRAGAEPTPYGVGFMRYCEGPALARRLMWQSFQRGYRMAMGGWQAKPQAQALGVSGSDGAVGTRQYRAQVASVITALRQAEDLGFICPPPGWDLEQLEHVAYVQGSLDAIRYCDQYMTQMVRGSLVSEIGGQGNASGSRAAAETLASDLEGAVAADDAELLSGAVQSLYRVILEVNFGPIPEAQLPREVIHAGPQTPLVDLVAASAASAAAGVEVDWEQVYRSRGIPFRRIDPLGLGDETALPTPVAGIRPRLRE